MLSVHRRIAGDLINSKKMLPKEGRNGSIESNNKGNK